MTVERLIAALKKFDPKKTVVVYDDELGYASYIELVEIEEKEVDEVEDVNRRVISHGKQTVVVL